MQDEQQDVNKEGDSGRTPQKTGTAEPTVREWAYSGKTFQAWCWLIVVVTLLLVGVGIWLTSFDRITNHVFSVWMVLMVVALFLWGHFLCVYFYRTLTIRYRLTEHRLEYIQGLFTKSIDPMELLYIDDIKVEQTIWDRFLNGGVGTITIFSKVDKTDSVLKLRGVEDPYKVYELIDKARCQVRAKRGFIST